LHCFTSAGKRLGNELTTIVWNDLLSDFIDHGFKNFTISGGEPLVEINKTISVISTLKQKYPKVKFYLFSNGLLFTDVILDTLKPWISGVGISIDGNRETHDYLRNNIGSYDKAITALRLLKTKRIPTFIQCMAISKTIPHLSEVLALASKYQIKAIRISHVDYFGRGKSNKSHLGLNQNDLEALYKMVKILKTKFPSIFITTNLVKKTDIVKFPEEFMIPNLQILSTGHVIPWEGLPLEYSLWKYPEESIDGVRLPAIVSRIGKFRELLNKAILKSISTPNSVVPFDNIISEMI